MHRQRTGKKDKWCRMLLRTLVDASDVKTAGFGVPIFVPK
jgi:hypothetical protein